MLPVITSDVGWILLLQKFTIDLNSTTSYSIGCFNLQCNVMFYVLFVAQLSCVSRRFVQCQKTSLMDFPANPWGL